MEETSKKMGFFTRLKYSIFKLENYTAFLGERLFTAIKYFLMLILLVSVVIVSTQSIIFYKMLNKGYNFYVNELPDFKYQDSKLHFSQDVEAYDDEYNFCFFANTDENISEDKIKEYEDKIYDSESGIIILNNKIKYIVSGNEIEYDLSEIASQFGIDFIDKNTLLEEYNNYGNTSVITMYFIIGLLELYLGNLIQIGLDVILLTIFGIIAARISGIKISMKPMSKISLHAITLPVIITGIYTSVYLITGFVIKYYNLMYLLIAYVYIVAAIMILKTDLIKQQEELIKIEEVRKEVKKEIEEENLEKEEKKKEKEEKNKEEEKEEGINGEPDGSEI